MERHTGMSEKYETFGGKRYRKVAHTRTKIAAERRVEQLRGEGFNARHEQEMRGHYNIYVRRRK